VPAEPVDRDIANPGARLLIACALGRSPECLNRQTCPPELVVVLRCSASYVPET
jgi:hypothetical protein